MEVLPPRAWKKRKFYLAFFVWLADYIYYSLLFSLIARRQERTLSLELLLYEGVWLPWDHRSQRLTSIVTIDSSRSREVLQILLEVFISYHYWSPWNN
jgi:hypothetical protein